MGCLECSHRLESLPAVPHCGPSLGGLQRDELTALLLLSQTKSYACGGVLFEQGECPHYFFMIRRGLVKVKRSTGLGRDVIVELLFPGDLCGALCVIDDTPYPATAISLCDTEVGRIPRADFVRLMEAHPEILVKACSTCREKMNQMRAMIVGLAIEHAEQRAARILMLLAMRLGRTANGVVRIPRLIDRQALAELIGSSVETAIRIISQFRHNGWVQEDSVTLTLLAPEAIRELSGLE